MKKLCVGCEECGEVVIKPSTVAVCPGGAYTFTCPSCGRFRRKPRDARVTDLLLRGGAWDARVPDAAREEDRVPDPDVFADLLEYAEEEMWEELLGEPG